MTTRDMIKFLEAKLTSADYSLFLKHDIYQHKSLKDTNIQIRVYEHFYDEDGKYQEKHVGMIAYNPFIKSRKIIFWYFRF